MTNQQPASAITSPASSGSKQWGMKIAHALWILAAIASVAILIGSLKGYSFWLQGFNPDEFVSDNFSGFNILSGATSLLTAVVCLFLSLILFLQKRRDPMALFVSFFIMAYGVIFVGPLDNLDALVPGASAFALARAQPVLLTLPTVLLIVLMPDGRFVPRWSRWVISITLAGMLLIPFIGLEAMLKYNTLPSQVMAGLWVASYGLAVAAQVQRYRHFSTSAQREQMRWMTYGLVLWILLIIAQAIPYTYLQYIPEGTPPPGWAVVISSLWWLTLAIIPVTLTIATLRYRLYDIDLVINRTLVYGGLTAILAGLYSASISLSQKAFIALTGARSDAAIVLTTLILASTFTPIKTRLQAIVDRRFKDAHDPLKRLSDFTRQVEGGIWMVDPRLALGRLLDEAVTALGSTGGTASLYEGMQERTVASRGSLAGEISLSVPLQVDDKLLGQLRLGPRENGLGYEEVGVKSLAATAGMLAHLLAPAGGQPDNGNGSD